MDKKFKDFIKDVFVDYISEMDRLGCIELDGEEIVCHSTKFSKSILAYVMLKQSMALRNDGSYTYATLEMIESEFSEMNDKYVFQSKANVRRRSINALIRKHFSVIFREMSKCFPSAIIFIGKNVGSGDLEIYARQQNLEGAPIDVRRLKKIREQFGIAEQNPEKKI